MIGETERVLFMSRDRELAVIHDSPLRLSRWEFSPGDRVAARLNAWPEPSTRRERDVTTKGSGWRARIDSTGRVLLTQPSDQDEPSALEAPGAFVPAQSLAWSAEGRELLVQQTNGVVWKWRMPELRDSLRALKLDWR
ncbi:MAG: hypothetical protein HYR88_14745 [Verrucomicrobia bacterium]|nr:hypothetical protein [Verrucomicrobiota bacterium]